MSKKPDDVVRLRAIMCADPGIYRDEDGSLDLKKLKSGLRWALKIMSDHDLEHPDVEKLLVSDKIIWELHFGFPPVEDSCPLTTTKE